VTPYWPAANGEVERMNRTIKRAVQCAVVEGKRWQDAIHDFLLGYRTTPHSMTGVAPSKLLFKHELRNDIPFVDIAKPDKTDREVNKRDAERKQRSKETMDKARRARETDTFEAGDKVLVKNLLKNNKLSTNYEPTPYTIIKVYHSSVKIQNETGDEYVRNKVHVKKYLENNTNTEVNVNKPTQQQDTTTESRTFWPLFVNVEEEEILANIEGEEEDIIQLEDLIDAFNNDHDDNDDNDDTIAYEEEEALQGHRYPQRLRRAPQRYDIMP
jgi:hypothetical protein